MKIWAKSVLAAFALTLATHASAAPVVVAVDTQSPGTHIPADFIGVSMEMKYLLPNEKGQYYFRADSQPLINMFKLLGIKNLRIGGNTTDSPTVDVPTGDKIDNFFSFTRAAGLKVIYTLRARNDTKGEAREAAFNQLARNDGEIAKYIMRKYKDDVLCFEIGNEPNVYAKTYPDYTAIFKKFISVIKSPEFATDAMFCGPNTTPGKPDWVRDFANEFGDSGNIVMITHHAYFGGNARKIIDNVTARDAMLSKAWVEKYQKMHDVFYPAVHAHKLPYRIEETNSYFNGGAKDVSNSFASALWSLDYLYWWASHDAAGLNFHTGDEVAAAGDLGRCWYALFWTSPHGFQANPIAYGVKAFELTSHGRLTPIKLNTDANITAYATLGDDKNLYLTVINKEHGNNAQSATLQLQTPGFTKPETLALSVPNNDITALSGETLGNAEINEDGTWSGKWSPATQNIELPPATALLIRLSPQ